MKNCLIIFLFWTCFVQSQTENNFKIEDNKVIWQKVFDTELNFNEICQAIKESGNFENIEIGENKTTTQLKIFVIDYEGAGYRTMNTSMYITYFNYTGFAIIEFKDNKYRITLKTIQLKKGATIPDVPMMEDTDIEFYVLKNGQFRKSFLRDDCKIFEYNFNKKFNFKKVKDW
jgi:hypothetical protein